MNNKIYFIIGIIVCAIAALILENLASPADWAKAPYAAFFGVALIIFGAGTFWQLPEFLEASIALIVVGIIAFVYGVNGSFEFFGEVFDDLVLRKGYN